MTSNDEILIRLGKIETMLTAQRTEYCDTQEAAVIMGIDNPRDLKVLHEHGVLPRYQRKGSSYKYKRSECLKAIQLVDNGTIKLQNNGNNNRQRKH